MAVGTYLSRKAVITALILLGCGAVGAAWGWYDINQVQHAFEQDNARKAVRPDVALILPPAPPVQDALAELEIDPVDLRIWELTARQPLAPRKEPLTPPSWKIVGVTTVGDDKNVLLLYENQAAAEIRKVGDRLPGGAKIVDISQEHLRILLNGQYLKLSLRKQ